LNLADLYVANHFDFNGRTGEAESVWPILWPMFLHLGG
jgi:hypothetical protein